MPPPVYQLNHPPHPFWDFVQEMNERPFWGGADHAGPSSAPPPPPQSGNHQPAEQRAAAANPSEKNDPAPADDPPEVDPSTLRGENCRHQRRCARRCGREQRGGHHEGGPHRGGWPFFAPPPFTMGGGPFGGPHGHHGPHAPPPPPPPFGFHGRGGRHHRGGPPFHRGGPRGGHHHRDANPSPPPHPGFNLGKFLNDLGERIGVDLNGAAEGLGIDRFMPSNSSPEADFEPKVDIFDLAEQFVIHASLPGAKKEDVGVDWDGEHSVLRLAGVVHRPEADEAMLQRLAVDGRKREVGVFEKAIRLGTAREPASIDVTGIKAKMADGVLVVRVPKVEKEHHKRDVPISSATPSPPRYEHQFGYEDHEMYDASSNLNENHPALYPEPKSVPASRTVSVDPSLPIRPNTTAVESPISPIEASAETPKESKEMEAGKEKNVQEVQESLPTYHDAPQERDDDWDESSSEEEGEYVKINVD